MQPDLLKCFVLKHSGKFPPHLTTNSQFVDKFDKLSIEHFLFPEFVFSFSSILPTGEIRFRLLESIIKLQ